MPGVAAAALTAAWAVYLTALVALGAYGVHRLSLVTRALGARRRTRGQPAAAPAREGELPVVTVQLPIFNE